MAQVSKPLLTIAIPTYNRSKYLARCLASLYRQNADLASVEIIVSNNCSTDNTKEVVKFHQDKGLKIKYVENEINKGPDFNIAKCYTLATGRYVMAMGDDDFFEADAIKKIIQVLEQDDYGVVFVNPYPFHEQLINKRPAAENSGEYLNYDRFFSKVNYNVSFITANIINKKYLEEQMLNQYLGSMLIQVPFILNAIVKSKKNYFIGEYLIAAQQDNSGGYNSFKVFGENFLQVLKNFELTHKTKKATDIIVTNLLISFFTVGIINLRLKQPAYPTNEIADGLKIFKNNFYYKTFTLPAIFLPSIMLRPFLFYIKAILKVRKIVKNQQLLLNMRRMAV